MVEISWDIFRILADYRLRHDFNRGIDTVKITALSNHKPGILNNYIRI
jgi:hypothetical protein